MPDDAAPAWRPTWFAGRDEPGDQDGAARLAAALRAINELLIQGMDDSAALGTLAGDAEALRDRLREAVPASAGQRIAREAWARDFRRASPVVGQSNVVAPPLRIWVDGETVRGEGSFGAAYEGPPGHVHGGFIAAAFDEVLGATQSLTEQSGMTGTLTVRYRRPTPLFRTLEFRGRLDRVSGRKIIASATLHAGETLCADAEAIFVAVDFAALAQTVRER
jgi:hypothetical protein